MKKILEQLNSINYNYENFPYNNSIWENFENTIIECKKNGYIFQYLSFNENEFNKLKDNPDASEIDLSDIIRNIEVLTFKLEQLNKADTDKLFDSSDKYKEFIAIFQSHLKIEIDVYYAILIGKNCFHQINNNTIGFSSCINEITDFKSKHYLEKHYPEILN